MKRKVITTIGIGALALSLGQSNVGAQEKGTVTVSSLNVRSGPGLNNNVKGCLYKGDTVAVLDKKDGWLKVQLSNSTVGWISEKYVKVGVSQVNAKVNGTNNLNVRSGAGTNYSVKTVISKGSIYKILSKSSGWYKIQLSDGSSGWVHGAYIKETTEKVSVNSPENSNANKVEEIKETKVNKKGKITGANSLNVRSGPGTNHSVKSSLKLNQVVELLSKSNGWYKIKLSNNTYGWISSTYVTITSSDESNTNKDDNTSNKDIITSTYAKTTTNLNVRSGAGTNYSVKSTLRNGEIVTIIKNSNSWYEIKTSSNITGWVSGKYLVATNESPNTNTSSEYNQEKGKLIVEYAMKELGKPYVWGGNGPNSFDCSGFTKHVYSKAIGVTLPRVSSQQSTVGKSVSTSDLKQGDLVYFATVTLDRTSHVGIYIGNNQFIHASGSQKKPDKVKISSLSGYYGNRLLGARRF